MTEPAVDALRGPAEVGTSDEVLALAAPALDFFAQWAEVWNARPSAARIDVEKDVREKFQESAGLDFRKFLADADALARAHETVTAARADADGAVTSLFRDWESAAASAAKESFEGIRPDDLADQLDGAAQLISETMTHVFTVLKSEVDEVLKLRVDEVAGAPLAVAQRAVRLAQGEALTQDELLDLARWLDGAAPGNDLHDRLRDCEPGDHDYAVRAARQWLDGPFATEFGGRYTAFRNLCATATSAIDGHFQALNRFLTSFGPVGTSTVERVVDTPAMGLPVLELPAMDLPGPGEPDPVTGSSSGDLDDSTTASSFSDIGQHVLDAPEHHPADNELGTAPGGDITFDPLGTGSEAMPEDMSGFGGVGVLGAMGGLGAAPDQQRSAARLGADVFDTRGSGGRISGSLDEPPGGGR
ncbi:hypothetical protein [Amycolatopsis sp. NPDC051903]|uniref:hypothetical protein n=1 Tax=Amycolatopsis sp. NPDC051903 TaxID=3363936 RepID=UPI0037B6213D